MKLNRTGQMALSIDMSRIGIQSEFFSLVAHTDRDPEYGILFMFRLLGMVFYMNHIQESFLSRNRQVLGHWRPLVYPKDQDGY